MTEKTAITEIEHRRRQFTDAMFNVLETDPWVNFKFTRSGDNLKLEYSFVAVKEIFQHLGKNINIGELGSQDLEDPETLAVVLYHGLRIHQPGMTLEKVEAGMSMRLRGYYTWVIQEAIRPTQPSLEFIQRFMPEQPEPETTDPEKETIELPPLPGTLR